MEILQHTVQYVSSNLKDQRNPSGGSYNAVSCQASSYSYIIQGFKEFYNTVY